MEQILKYKLKENFQFPKNIYTNKNCTAVNYLVSPNIPVLKQNVHIGH